MPCERKHTAGAHAGSLFSPFYCLQEQQMFIYLQLPIVGALKVLFKILSKKHP